MRTFVPRFEILPPEQKALWPELKPAQSLGFVLYGGTAIALRRGHRASIDFDFFNSTPLDKGALLTAMPFLKKSRTLQETANTYVVLGPSNVKVSFFGGLDFGRVEEPEQTADGVLIVASAQDLMAAKLKTILQRSEAKDYQDLAALIRGGLGIDLGLAAANEIYKPTFPPVDSLRAMVYFEEGDMDRLSSDDRQVLVEAAKQVRELPAVRVFPNISPS